MEALQATLSQLSITFKERMDNFEAELQKETDPCTLNSLAADFAAFKKHTLQNLKMLQEQIQLLQLSVDHIEMYSRRKILLLHGVAESNQEDVTTTVTNLITTKLKIDGFSPEHIRRCHRMGKSPTSSGKPRPILFKLCDGVIRNKIWMAKTKLKGSGVTLSEFLTKFRHNMFKQTRQRFGVTKSWTRNGIIYVLDSANTACRIMQLSDLDKVSVATNVEPPVVKEKEARAPSRQRRVLAKK